MGVKTERSIDVTNLPRNKKGIDWLCSCGHKCKYTYGNNSGIIEILNYDRKTQIVTVLVDKTHTLNISSRHLVACKIGRVFEKTIGEMKPDIHDMVLDESHLNYSYACGKKITLKCRECGHIKDYITRNVYYRGFKCQVCGGGRSYPERFVSEILDVFGVEFETEKIFDWNADRRYDFYIQSLNCVIETHGIQHYEQSNRGMFLCDIQKNDAMKKRCAIENGIVNYIEIDCSNSDPYYIINSMRDVDFENIIGINLSSIDVGTIDASIMKSNIVKAGEMYDMGYSIDEISKKLHVCNTSVYSYINKCSSIGLCTFVPEKRYIYSEHGKKNRILWVDENMEFDSIVELVMYAESISVKLIKSCVCLVASGKRKHHKGFTFKYVE